MKKIKAVQVVQPGELNRAPRGVAVRFRSFFAHFSHFVYF